MSAQEACRYRGVHGYWCCAPKGHRGDHIWNDENGIPGTVAYLPPEQSRSQQETEDAMKRAKA